MTWAIGALLFAGLQLAMGCLFGSFIKFGMVGEPKRIPARIAGKR